MAGKGGPSTISQFRNVYKPPSHFNRNAFKLWYPGHMDKGMKIMQGKALYCDFLLEVHDARIPLTGRNTDFNVRLKSNCKMLVLNKVDLAKPLRLKKITQDLKQSNTVFFCNSKANTNSSIKKLIQFLKDQIEKEENDNENVCETLEPLEEHNPLPSQWGQDDDVKSSTSRNLKPSSEKEEEKSYKILVCGIPNTGKSSFINSARRTSVRAGKATPVGPIAGVTRSVMTKILINRNPRIYIFDTPGILPPRVHSIEEGMKLAAVGSYKDSSIGHDVIADYILFTLNKHKEFRYTEMFDLPRPTDDFDVLVSYIARKLKFENGGYPDIFRSSQYFITCFRNGDFGRLTLD